MASGWPAAVSRIPSTFIAAAIAKKPKTRPGSCQLAAMLGRKKTSWITRATISTPSPADAMTSSTRDSHDGPSRNAPVEMMLVAITNGK